MTLFTVPVSNFTLREITFDSAEVKNVFALAEQEIGGDEQKGKYLDFLRRYFPLRKSNAHSQDSGTKDSLQQLEGEVAKELTHSVGESSNVYFLLLAFHATLLRDLQKHQQLENLVTSLPEHCPGTIKASLCNTYAYDLNSQKRHQEATTEHEKACSFLADDDADVVKEQHYLYRALWAACYNGLGYSLRKTKKDSADIERAAEKQMQALSVFASNIASNNAAITFSKSPTRVHQQKAIDILKPKVEENQKKERYLFVSPYYLCDALLRDAFLAHQQGNRAMTLQRLKEVTPYFAWVKKTVEVGNGNYSENYRRKSQARILRLEILADHLRAQLEERSVSLSEKQQQALQLYRMSCETAPESIKKFEQKLENVVTTPIKPFSYN